MSWRTVVITGIAKLDYKLECLVVRKSEETIKIHLSEIGVLLIESASVSLTTYLISELSKHKIKVIFCDEKHNPISENVPYYGSHDTSIKVRQQVLWDSDLKKLIWTEIVREKIRNQMLLLRERGLNKQAEMLEGYIAEIEIGDATNREGHAAKVYFNALFGLDFSRSSENPTNAALNYGYGILLSHFSREIVASGYITQLGLFHDNMFNQFNLASDLMEPFRPLIDRVVAENDFCSFGHDEKMLIVSSLNEEVLIDSKKQLITTAIRIYCHSIFDAINERDTSLISFYRNEL